MCPKWLHLWYLTHFAPALQGRHKRSHSCLLIVRSYLHPLIVTLHVSLSVAAISLFSPLKLPPSLSIRSLKLGSGFPAHIRADATCCNINRERISVTHCGRSEKTSESAGFSSWPHTWTCHEKSEQTITVRSILGRHLGSFSTVKSCSELSKIMVVHLSIFSS